MLWGIKVATIISFLKQVLKLFWDNCKLVVLSHLIEKFCTFFANIGQGKQNPFYSTATGRLGFQVSGFLNTGIERRHQYLSYKLLDTSVTLFLHIELRDSHSIPITPCIFKPTLNFNVNIPDRDKVLQFGRFCLFLQNLYISGRTNDR